jgi:hypothetical protein
MMIGLNLVLHVARFSLCLLVIWLIAKRFFDSALWLRIKLKVDTELMNAVETLNRMRNNEKKWCVKDMSNLKII